MSFDFFKTIIDYGDTIVDFLAGEKEPESYESEVMGKKRERSGGFLDFAKSGAKAYKAMTDEDDDEEAFEAVEYKKPSITRYTGRAPVSPGQRQAAQVLGAADARVQRMYRNLQNRTYANADMNRIGRDLRVQVTQKQGRRTVGLEPARVPSVKEAAPAAIRKHEKDVV